MIPSSLDNLSIARLDGLPPLHVNKKTKDSKKWKEAVLDAFEYIGIQQIRENSTYIDRYRMINGQMSYQELSEVVPHLKGVEDLFNSMDIPTFLKHYDLIGIIVKELVGKYMEILDKFHVVDLGEIAINDFLEFKNKEIEETLNQLFENEINLELARKGIDPNKEEFQSQEEQQQYIAMLEQERAKIISPERLAQKQKSFKTVGVEWGETTLERDTETLNLREKEKTEFRDYLLTGRCFREHKLYGNMYDSKTWSPINTFVSKELDEKHAENLMYVGRVHTYTPQEVIREFHTKIPADIAGKILGDDKLWKNAFSDGVASGTINQAISNNFLEIDTNTFLGQNNYNYYLGLQDVLGIPLGEKTYIDKDGRSETVNSYLPKYKGKTFGGNTYLSKILRPDIIKPRTDLCQVTEVYFIAYDYVGYLTYEDPNTGAVLTELVTEDILPEFIKERGIKQSYKSLIVDQVDSFPVNTIQWFLTENTYYGVKIQSPYLTDPLYLECDLMDHQIKGATPFRRRLPVAGYLGKSPIEPAIPWQAKFNLALNQVWNLLEKEIGMFFLMDVKMIPDQYLGEDAEESFGKLMDVAKSVGVFPVATTAENGGNNNPFNQFATYNLSFSQQIQDRTNIANYCKMAAYEAIGIQQVMQQPTGYETAAGVKIGQQVSFARVSEIFDDFGAYKKGLLDTHLAVAQYAQSNSMDQSLYWTKSDASIKFLKLSDPKLPLRNIGVLPVDNARKRFELENLKNIILQNNTAGADVLELSELATSDHMQGLIEAARKGRQYREQAQKTKYDQDSSLLDKENAYKKEQEEIAWQRKKYEIDTTNQAKLAAASLMATGRAADSKANDASFDQINQNTKNQTTLLKIEQDQNRHNDKMDFQQRKMDQDKTLAERKIAVQEEANRLKEKQIESTEYTSSINKN